MPCTGASQRSQQHAEMHLVTMRICVLVMLQLNKLRLLPVLMYRLGFVMSSCRKCLFPLVKHCFVGMLEHILIALTHVLLVSWCCVDVSLVFWVCTAMCTTEQQQELSVKISPQKSLYTSPVASGKIRRSSALQEVLTVV